MPEAQLLPPKRPMLAEGPSEFVLNGARGGGRVSSGDVGLILRFVLHAGESWFAGMCGRFRGWLVSDV